MIKNSPLSGVVKNTVEIDIRLPGTDCSMKKKAAPEGAAFACGAFVAPS
jgi:hypothetical protein